MENDLSTHLKWDDFILWNIGTRIIPGLDQYLFLLILQDDDRWATDLPPRTEDSYFSQERAASPPSSSSSSSDGSMIRERYSSSESEDTSRPNTLGTELLARLAKSKK